MVSANQKSRDSLAGSAGSGALRDPGIMVLAGSMVVSSLNWGGTTSKLTHVFCLMSSRIEVSGPLRRMVMIPQTSPVAGSLG